MGRRLARGRLAVAAGVAFLAAACSSSSGPNGGSGFTNPTATTAAFKSVDTTFKTPAFNSFKGLSGMFTPMSPPVATMLHATALSVQGPAAYRDPYALAAQHVAAIRAGLRSQVISLAIINPTYLGKTYVLTGTAGSYHYTASTRMGAPANGVRFILYAVDPITFQPVTPLAETGYADLIDNSTAMVNSLQVIVVEGTTTYANYAITGSDVSGVANLTLVGFVSDGTTPVNFNISYKADNATGTLTETTTISAPSKSFQLGFNVSATSSVSGTVTTTNITLDFTLTSGTDTASAHGMLTTTVDSSNQSTTDNGTITVTVNGSPFATITLTTGGVTITGPGGGALSADQQAAIAEMFSAGGLIELLIVLLIVPFLVA
jgi:hypothetical protein